MKKYIYFFVRIVQSEKDKKEKDISVETGEADIENLVIITEKCPYIEQDYVEHYFLFM